MQQAYTWFTLFSSMAEAMEKIPENTVSKRLVNEKWICFSRKGSEFYAFDENCPHQNESLIRGECVDGRVICPVHRYSFDMKTGAGDGLYLQTYPIKVSEEQALQIGFKKSFGAF